MTTNPLNILDDLFSESLLKRPDHPAVIEQNKTTSFKELDLLTDSLAAWLLDVGVKKGDRVGIHLRKSTEEIVSMLAVARIGAVFVNINHQWTSTQVQYIVDDCDIKTLILDQQKARKVLSKTLTSKLENILVKGNKCDIGGTTLLKDIKSSSLPSITAPESKDLVALIYTSGSTGMPKGVMLTHSNIVEGAISVASYLHISEDDRLLSLLPFSFDYGLNQLTTSLLAGGTVVLQAVAMASEIVKTLKDKNVTGFAAVPPTWVEVVRFLESQPTKLADLRYITNSGGKIPLTILDALPEVLPDTQIFLMYGLTEAFRSTYLPPEMFSEKKGSIGFAIPGAEISVINDNGICGPGEQGELIHGGKLVSAGYWNDSETTNEKFKICPHLENDQKVVYSGDIVRIDEDNCLWFLSRHDSMIKCSGFRISPAEVEDIIYESKLAMNAIAFGVADESLGQTVHAAVVLNTDSPETGDDLARFCQQNMPHYMVPKTIHYYSEPFEKTSSGKFNRPSIIKECTNNKGA